MQERRLVPEDLKGGWMKRRGYHRVLRIRDRSCFARGERKLHFATAIHSRGSGVLDYSPVVFLKIPYWSWRGNFLPWHRS